MKRVQRMRFAAPNEARAAIKENKRSRNRRACVAARSPNANMLHSAQCCMCGAARRSLPPDRTRAARAPQRGYKGEKDSFHRTTLQHRVRGSFLKDESVDARVSDVWNFKKDYDGRWNWQRQSLHHELIEEGRTPFATFEDCLADARRCGYTGSWSVADAPVRDASGRLVRRTRR